MPQPKTALVIVPTLLCLALTGCTSGDRCNEDWPCPDTWECIDEYCGRRQQVPICHVQGGGYCTRVCERGPETGSFNPGDCPAAYDDCRWGGDALGLGEQMVCIGSVGDANIAACQTSEDCAGVEITEWLSGRPGS